MRVAAVMFVAVAWMVSAGAGSALAAPNITASATGPSELASRASGSFTITISNSGDSTAHGVQLTVSFPNVPTQEAIGSNSCPYLCLGNGHGTLVAVVGDIKPGASVPFVFGFSTMLQATLNHPWTVSSTDAGSASGTYTVTVDPPPPPPSPTTATTLTVAMTDAAKITGLLARQTVTIVNTGANPALNVKLGVIFGEGTVLKSLNTTAGTCTNSNPIVVSCNLGTIAAGTTFTLRLTLHLPVHPSSNDVIAQVKADTSPFVSVNARPYFRNRYWPCICASATYANGWMVPGISPGYTVDADDTVHLANGYVITPDGVLHFPDGRTIVVDAAGNDSFVPKSATGSSAPAAGSQSTLQLVRTVEILGVASVGSRLRFRGGVWNRRPDRVEFQWQTCSATGRCRAIAKPSSTLFLPRTLTGKRLRVTETAWFGGARRQLSSRSVLVRSR